MVNCRFFGFHALGRINFNHIKARLKLRFMLRQPQLCCGAQPCLLARVHKLGGARKGVGFAKLDLHKHQILPIPGNQVDFSEPAGSIPFQNSEAPFFQILRGLILAPSPGVSMSEHGA